MGFKFGMDAKLYFCAAGIGGSPTWTEISNVKDVTIAFETATADVTTRGGNGFRLKVATLKDFSIEFEMVWDTADAGFTAIKNAYFNKSILGIAAMTGDIEIPGEEGPWADCMVTNFSRAEPLEDAIKVSVKLEPTYSANAPFWKTV